MEKGEFVQWASEDDEGRFRHKGRILSKSSDGVDMLTEYGIMFVPKGDGKITKTARVAGLRMPKETSSKPVEEKKAVIVGGTRYEQIKQIVDSELEQGRVPSRLTVLELATKLTDMSAASAGTTFAKVKKDLGL
jgi:hypothetical protein